jgi:DnaA family protein
MGGNEGAAQLPLRLALPDDATLDNFLPDAASRPLCAALSVPPDVGADATAGAASTEPLIFLHGPRGTGKTHLLQAACHLLPKGSLYLPISELRDLSAAELLHDLEQLQRVAVDDPRLIAGDAGWEEALFHLINRCRASGCQLLFADRQPPAGLQLRLPDLRSRLAGGVTWALQAPDEARLREVLAFRARRRGLEASDAVLGYLCNRASRSLPELLALLALLDEASLQAKRPLTVPMVRDTLGW